MEDRLDLPFQHHRYHGLRHAITDSRYAQYPDATMLFRYLHHAHRRREVAARGHPIPDLIQVTQKVLLELRDVHRVHTRCAPVRPDLLPSLLYQPLRDLERLTR